VNRTAAGPSSHFLLTSSCSEVLVKHSQTRDDDRVLRLHPAVGVVCPGCGARAGKPCVSTVPHLGVGAVGAVLEGVHVERIASAREAGIA